VTISVKNLFLALTSKEIKVGFLGKGLLHRYSIAHVHSYSPLKRLILLLIGKLWAKKNVFTIHGMHFDQTNILNIINLMLTDGVVILNEKILETAPNLKKKSILRTTALVSEGIENASSGEPILSIEKTKPRLLLYAQHGDSFDGEPIYGVPFIKSVIPELIKKYTIIFTDINNVYPELSNFDPQDVFRINHPINFNQLLTEVDVYLRPTSKDGDAIAIQEAILHQTPVLASDVVDRPNGVITYKYGDQQSFLTEIDKVISTPKSFLKSTLASVEEYLTFYQKL